MGKPNDSKKTRFEVTFGLRGSTLTWVGASTDLLSAAVAALSHHNARAADASFLLVRPALLQVVSDEVEGVVA